ncbi:D-2-hydroxyacid dehydrogenase [Paenibacillus cremeus]|uniref:D-2-hydroxyacid dehydrogenase n=1 Tax=Paenibacillus cremeus TaxID=2163881 RepID=A0A559K585_9BACL|nr:D-2-hydroxyacid dehydrogenase [Paenibacillus cremeus]TVY07266.1 D-2-hydroxyacid dehydrogenase [Paenibacillus cremeus]
MEINNLLITGRMYRELEILKERRPDKQFRFLAESEVTEADLDWADAYVAFKPVPTFHFGSLRWVHALGAGVDAFLFRKPWQSDVLLTRTTGEFGRKIAEYCLGYIMADLNQHATFARQQARSEWTPAASPLLSSIRAVVFGTGSIGQEIARVLSLLGAQVTGISFSGEAKPFYNQVCKLDAMGDCLARADWVINTLPLTNATHHLFNQALLAELNGAGFINVGRGPSVDTRAMLDALDRGSVRLAVLDVFEEEPLAPDSPLWSRPDVQITPHISAVTSVEEAAEGLLSTLEQLEKGATLTNQVNTERGY